MVSVIMPVYNSDRFLSQAIQSILDQTYSDFELIIIDDGSNDRSWDIVLDFQKRDERIRSLRHHNNKGVAAASNRGLEMASGKYIARMDSDDISLPDRFADQVGFLEAHPDIGILGGKMRFMDENGKLKGVFPVIHGNLNIHWNFMFESPFSNTTVMYRKSLVEDYGLKYNQSAFYGEDYDFWCRLLPMTQGENLAKVVLHCRLHPLSLTPRYADQHGELDVQRSVMAIQTYLPEFSDSRQEIIELQRAIKGFPASAKRQRAKLLPVYFRIWEAFCQKHKGEDLRQLKETVYAWAARLLLYPLFKPGSLQALLWLTKKDWKWPIYLVKKVPYYISRRKR
jgi:glycosyltransferase involved in cell wall biosynthesis